MKMPCQMVVWYLLPAINAALTREMKELGMRNSEIAQALDITPSILDVLQKGAKEAGNK